MAQLSHLLSPDQKPLTKEIDNLTDNFKKSCAVSANILEEERKKLIVVQEVFKKKTNAKIYNKSFREKSFKLALEELLEEKSQVTQIKKVIKEEPEDDEENTKFYSALDFEKELNEVQKSFIVPEIKNSLKAAKEADRNLPNTILPSELTEVIKGPSKPLSASVRRLVEANPVFIQFPVKDQKSNFRNQMPILRDPNVKINIWAILKENIGKDLSRIAMPVYLNEPISMLQKTSEFIEYHNIFRQANKCENEYLRLAYVTSVSFIQLASSINRMKKPFNPLLGETFEYYENDLKSVFEQVSHHPPICAFHCESNDFIVSGSLYLKSKLSLSGFEFFPLGEFKVTLKRTKEVFVLKRPSNSVHNYIIGKMYIWVNGTMECTNTVTKSKMSITFKPKGWTSKTDYEVEGKITNAEDETKYHVFGRWDSFLSVIDAQTKQETKIISKNENPENYELQYYFSKHSINLNNLTQDLMKMIAPTDSRLRTDQRAYEYGNLDLASTEKERLEQNQRKRRKITEDGHENFEPRWFNFSLEGEVVTSSLKEKNSYFKFRENGEWPNDLLDLYND
jgi:hypothetical protein